MFIEWKSTQVSDIYSRPYKRITIPKLPKSPKGSMSFLVLLMSLSNLSAAFDSLGAISILLVFRAMSLLPLGRPLEKS